MLPNLLKTLLPARDAGPTEPVRLDAWADWLTPLPEAAGAGRDPAYEDAFFALKDEAAKLSGIDDALILRACEQVLKAVGKDLRVAGYYAFARLRQDGPAGFADGLELCAALVDRFGEGLLPARTEAKKAALEWLASARMLDRLAGHDTIAPADRARAAAALGVLIARTEPWAEAARPNLHALVAALALQAAPGADVLHASATPATQSTRDTTPARGPIASARDLLEQARAMAHYLRDQEHGYLSAARLVRSVRWDTLHDVPPADMQGRTRLVPPRAELRQHMKRLVLQQQWHELLERVEGAFMEGANHLWLDLQTFQHVALDHAGAPYSGWREQLRADFALFLERLPGIERLAFQDGTPFADDATLEWIARHAVVRDLEAGEAIAPLPVAADKDASDGSPGDWPEIEAQARDLAASQGLEAAFAWLDSLPGMRSDRQRFLQRLVMARLAAHAGRIDAATPLLDALDAAAQRITLAQWNPVLGFEVKLQLIHALKAAGIRKDADKPALARRLAQLQGELTVLDPARALALS